MNNPNTRSLENNFVSAAASRNSPEAPSSVNTGEQLKNVLTEKVI
ncbi:MAG TPA: hypothetical protein VLT36_22820 [Candidatus Dormibacteraeota bacterium]|nr:hypothetical protein [Candidatus Dormibacteraeota bacterium]